MFFCFKDPATTETFTYLHTLALRDALPIYASGKTGLIWFGETGTTRQFGPNCDVGEIIIFDRPLTGSEKALIEGYLAHKWERADLLPAAHQYKLGRASCR